MRKLTTGEKYELIIYHANQMSRIRNTFGPNREDITESCRRIMEILKTIPKEEMA